MDFSGLAEADQHLVYGLLLKKKRSRAQERKVLSVVRSEKSLADKITTIVGLDRVKVPDLADGSPAGPARRSPAVRRKRKAALVVDTRQEILRLLKKCTLKRDLAFSRAEERYDALNLLLQTRARLLVVNEVFEKAEDYVRYFEICRAIVPGVRIVFLGLPPAAPGPSAHFGAATRFLPKPLNVGKLEEAVRTLMGPGGAASAAAE